MRPRTPEEAELMREVETLRYRWEQFGDYGDRELLIVAVRDLILYREAVGLSDDWVEPLFSG